MKRCAQVRPCSSIPDRQSVEPDNEMKVLLAHLIPAPFTQQVARALDDANLLQAFYCTLVDDPTSLWQSCLKGTGRLLGKDVARDLRRRAVTEIPMSKVRQYPWRETCRMAVQRSFRNASIDDRVFHWGRDGFDRWVSQHIAEHNAVYGYEYGVKHTFVSAQSRGVSCIYDVPSPEHDFVENLLSEEMKRFPELQTDYRNRVGKLQAERTEHRRQEWECADLVIAASTFTANTWIAAGWSHKRVVVVPYGAPPVSKRQRLGDGSGPLRILWVGTFSVRKGAHYLLSAWRNSVGANRNVTLDIYGAVTLPESLLENLPSNVRFHGSVPRQELDQVYAQSDALMFPTLCDGFGMVVTEAFSHGLPVITTTRAGAADVVKHGENGFIVNVASSEALEDIIQRCLDERGKLADMRFAARQSAAAWQWSDYRTAIATNVQSLQATT